MTAREAASAARRRRILNAARRRLRGDGDTLAATLIGDLFGRASVEDLEVYAPAEIAGFARSAAALLGRRQRGRPDIRISDPDFGGRARRHADVTLVEIINDNMPFLVDSIMAELQDFDAEVRLVAHPVVTVTRDAAGSLTDYAGLAPAAADSAAIRESLVTVHIDRLLGEQTRRKELAERLATVLTEVRVPSTAGRPCARACKPRSPTTGPRRRRLRRPRSPRRSPSSNGCSTTTSPSSASANTTSSAAPGAAHSGAPTCPASASSAIRRCGCCGAAPTRSPRRRRCARS